LRLFFIALTTFFCLATTGQTETSIKTLVFCSRESPDSFNPQLTTSQATFDASSRQIYDRLVTFHAGSAEIVPAIAESWRISNDRLEYVFRLRADVSFHATRDFRPTRKLTAEDVVFSFARQLDRKHPWHRVSGGGYQYFRGLGASILSAEYAEAMLEAGTPERLDREPVGTGPFVLVQYQRDALIRYVAHRDYWRGAARLDNLVFAITPDAAVRMQRLRDGECHIIDQPDPVDLPALMTDPAILVARKTAADLGYLAFNTQKPVLSDVRVRQALSLAIDRQAIVDGALGGIGTAASGPLPPGLRPNPANETAAQYDPDRARDILAKAGYGGLNVNIWAMPVSRSYMGSARRVAETIRDQWAAIGVKATVTVPDWETFLKHSMVGAHEAILFGWISETLDPDIFLSPILSCAASTSGANRSHWCDPGFDRLLLEARRATSPAEREAIYDIALGRLEEQVPLVPLVHSVSFTPLRRGVTGYVPSSLGGHSFYGVDLQ
jgi:dipeptide transport system substrate-binding protein